MWSMWDLFLVSLRKQAAIQPGGNTVLFKQFLYVSFYVIEVTVEFKEFIGKLGVGAGVVHLF